MLNDDHWTKEWNDLHIKYCKEEMEDCHTELVDGFLCSWPREEMVNHRNNKMADYCEEMIVKAKDAYYNTDSPIMDANRYAPFQGMLKLLRPNSKVLVKVGG